MKVKLTSNDMWSPALAFAFDKLPVVIGSNGSANIVVMDRWVCDTHCELDQLDGELVVRDLQSKHGILLNGESVTQSAISSGDTLIIGIRSFSVSYRQPANRRQPLGNSSNNDKAKSQTPRKKAVG